MIIPIVIFILIDIALLSAVYQIRKNKKLLSKKVSVCSDIAIEKVSENPGKSGKEDSCSISINIESQEEESPLQESNDSEILKKSSELNVTDSREVTSVSEEEIYSIISRRHVNSEISKSLDPSLQIVIMFDVTGSMYPYFNKVRNEIEKIIDVLFEQVDQFEISIGAFRNYGNETKYGAISYLSPFSNCKETIKKFLSTIKKGGGGGDCLCCMDYTFHEVIQLPWYPTANKSVVVIGDVPPRGFLKPYKENEKMYDYNNALDILALNNTPLYSVFVNDNESKRVNSIRKYYELMAKKTDGKFIDFNEIDILTELIIGISMDVTGNLDSYLEKLQLEKPNEAKRLEEILVPLLE